MLILTSTTDTIKIVLANTVAANQLRVYSTYRDTQAGSTFMPARNVVLTNNTTAVDAVAAPAASTQRVIDFISVLNKDTANAQVTISLDANGTAYELIIVTLAPNERLEYADSTGFRVLTNAGSIKQTYQSGTNPTSSSLQTVILGSDVTNNNATANTIADITGLSFAVTAGLRYFFRFVIQYTAAATTTGARFSINGPASPTELRYSSRYSLTATTITTNDGLAAYDLPAASNVSSAATGANIAEVFGFIVPSANGAVIARFASEVLSSAIVAKAGSFCQYQQL